MNRCGHSFSLFFFRLYNSSCSGPSIYICAARLWLEPRDTFHGYTRAETQISRAIMISISTTRLVLFAWPYRNHLAPDHIQTTERTDDQPWWNEEKSPSPSSELNELKASHFASFAGFFFVFSLLSRSSNSRGRKNFSFLAFPDPILGLLVAFLCKSPRERRFSMRGLELFHNCLRWEIGGCQHTKMEKKSNISAFLISISGPPENHSPLNVNCLLFLTLILSLHRAFFFFHVRS